MTLFSSKLAVHEGYIITQRGEMEAKKIESSLGLVE
jgi:hypothetical protein